MSGRRAIRLVLRALAIWALVELLCLGAWRALEGAGLSFAPAPTARLTEAQEEGLRRILSGEAQYIAFSPALGWALQPGGRAGPYTADPLGRRARPGEPPPPGARRILAFGDSFTHGDEVGDGSTWPALLDEGSADLEVQNYGVPGYGPDQALLRYQGSDEDADLVILGFMSADLARITNTFPPFLEPRTALALPKPSVTLSGDQLQWRENPARELKDLVDLLEAPEEALARLGALDPYFSRGPRASRWDALPSARLLHMALAPRAPFAGVLGGRPYDRDSVEFRACVALISQFDAHARARGAAFGVLLLPGRADLLARAAGAELAYAPLEQALHALGLPVLDAAVALAGPDLDARFMPGGHYSAAGNQRVADAMRPWIAGTLTR